EPIQSTLGDAKQLSSAQKYAQSSLMRVLITCGPSYEPIDQVRRLTNLSTGTLGATLANAMTDAGHAVTCLRGEGSTYSGRLSAETVLSFGTNDDLSLLLKRLSSTSRFDVVL